MKIKHAVIFLFLLVFLVPLAKADDPFLTDNPEVLKPREQYIVFYSFYNQFRFGKFLQAPALEYDMGLAPNLELDTFTAVANVFSAKNFPNMSLSHHDLKGGKAPNATGLGDMYVELKYRFIQETARTPQIAFAPNFILPLGNYQRGLGNGRFFWYPALTAQKTIGKWLLYGTTGYVINGAPDLNNYLFSGVVAQHQFTDRLALGLELYSQGRSGRFIAASTILDVGTQYEFEKDCTLFFSLGHSIAGENQTVGYFGIGWSR